MTAETVLDLFKDITRIPRESGHEGPMTAFLQQFAAKRSLECRTDKTGNVVIVKEAAPGKENVPILVLQAHQDMVCEKDADFPFDFLTQPIPFSVEDGWMVSKHTTLGADDGIGVAACLALLDSDLPTGKLECLFTISEETGMDGAFALEPGFFEGKTLINLDSEDEGQLFVGCAGGMETTATFEFKREALRKGYKTLKIRVTGGKGGHSGDDINKERANALRLLVRFLYTELQYDFQLLTLDGGNKSNAICREAEAFIAVPADDIAEWVADAEAFDALIKAEYKASDALIGCSVTEEVSLIRPIEEGDAANIIMTLLGVPHGVEKMSMDIPGLVETSTNLAAAHIEGDVLKVVTSQRSSVVSELHAMAERVEAAFFLGSFDVEHHGEYPGWKPNLESRILKVSVESYKRLFKTDPEVKAIHAGLECGLFLEKFPDLDMISFGPTLRNVHAPGEKLELASLDKFVAHLTDVVLNFA
ncbi:MAG: aminoacyl-histidine dipeptidase [Bacteroidales bacterium]|nr:aminoacyl-histidine dipeptidase [Bacteroidales bacterium]MBR6863839.1 aminoacyl-histidine dipeptidase [Bacteroidales bacterium]